MPEVRQRSADRLRCQYAVVGSGAGGSVAAALLAEAGRDVLLIEEGHQHVPDAASAEIGTGTRRLYRNGGAVPLLGRPVIPFAEACCVGGGTVINGGLIWRTPTWILDEWRREHGLDGYGERELAKHFDLIERDLQVKTHRLESDANLDSLYLHRGAERLGWHVAMAPRAVRGCVNVNLCPIGACGACGKQSTLENYIPRAVRHGARLLAGSRVARIAHSHGTARQLTLRVRSDDHSSTRTVTVDFEHLVLAAGAVQTPHLLQRSGLGHPRGHRVQCHLNLKTVAFFDEALSAHCGTIFTAQVQEHARQGILIMATNHAPHFLALTLARHGEAAVDRGLERYFHAAIFTAMVRARSSAHVVSRFGDQPLLWYRLGAEDVPKIGTAITRTAEVLLAAGAQELYLPVKGSPPVRTLEQVDGLLERMHPSRLDMITVHVMASCPMGPSAARAVVRPDGRLWHARNVSVADASILPSNMGESPQGTIMAFVHEVMGRHLSGRVQ